VGGEEEVKINLNDTVKVILTTAGEARYSKYMHEIKERCGLVEMHDTRPANRDGKRSFQLWELMHIFGQQLFNGCEVPFIGCALEWNANRETD
jgi:hypothetical protein